MNFGVFAVEGFGDKVWLKKVTLGGERLLQSLPRPRNDNERYIGRHCEEFATANDAAIYLGLIQFSGLWSSMLLGNVRAEHNCLYPGLPRVSTLCQCTRQQKFL